MTFAGAAALCVARLAASATANRGPTRTERQAIVAALLKSERQPGIRVDRMRVSTIDTTYATYNAVAPTPVGAHSPKGDGRWGHADLSANDDRTDSGSAGSTEQSAGGTTKSTPAKKA